MKREGNKDEGKAVLVGTRFDEAVRYAAVVHGGAVRKATTIPYVAHLLGVAALVLEDGGDEDEAVAAEEAERHISTHPFADPVCLK